MAPDASCGFGLDWIGLIFELGKPLSFFQAHSEDVHILWTHIHNVIQN